jgi:two-component system sensor histidine kinase KdpD
MNDQRPDPELLLERIREKEAQDDRGKLKVFFGASAGVGKTFAMLEAARRKRVEGVDVVAGWIETHGRAETAALLEGLEILPARQLDYRGAKLREFDLDAALARQPALLLLDELAHTNAPGSRHVKRWQDVNELLEAGIDVWTTLNVQHVGSLADVVARITEVPVREIVPDRVLDEADEVEIVDLPPDELLVRLAEGKVYVPAQAREAMRRFFRKGNLFALRELALRRTADLVDEHVRDYRRTHGIERTWPVAERILVCIRPNPETARLVQAGRRLASRLGAEWIVVHVESPSQRGLTDAERQALASAFKLAEELGAETTVLRGEDVAQVLLTHARAHNVSKIVVGKPARPRWRDRLFGSPVDAVVRGSGEIDVYVIAAAEKELAAEAVRAARPKPASAGQWIGSIGTVLLCTAVCWLMFGHFDRSNLIMVYLLGNAFVATRFGRWPAGAAACVSVAAFDFFFVPPYLTFAVSDTQYVITFVVMLIVTLLISGLTVRAMSQAEAAHQRGRRTQLLYDTTRELASMTGAYEIARAGCRRVAEVMRGTAAVFLPGRDGILAPAEPDAPAPFAESREQAVADWVFRHGLRAGRGTDTLPGASAVYLPLPGGDEPVGVLGVAPADTLLPLSPVHLDLLETLARLIAAPLERSALAREAERARVAAEGERMRSTLLSSVSHDFRTPLAAILGAASSLRQDPAPDPRARRELVHTIEEEAARLDRLVTNLLNMTRLESGEVRPQREWHSLEEIVGTAARRMEAGLDGRRLLVAIAEDLPLL